MSALMRAACLLLGAAFSLLAAPSVSAQPAGRAPTAERARDAPSKQRRTKRRAQRSRRSDAQPADVETPRQATGRAGAVRSPRARRRNEPLPSDAPARKTDAETRPAGRAAPERPTGEDASSTAARAAAAAVDSEIVKEGATSVKVMKFSGLDIEGRLRSPQLIYFVQRARAEFERPALPHRSFLPELARSTEREPAR